MPAINCPVCFLTDKNGNILNPYKADAIKYVEVSCRKICPQEQAKLPSGKLVNLYKVTVYIKGYISVFIDNHNFSGPIQFSKIEHLYLYAPPGSTVKFTVKNFSCCAVPVNTEYDIEEMEFKLIVNIDTVVRVLTQIDITVRNSNSLINSGEHEICPDTDEICISVYKVLDHKCFKSKIIINYKKSKKRLLKANVYQYNALSEKDKKTYTSDDELKKYGDKGILNPDDVSYLNLYINGVLQPQVVYKVEENELTLETEDAPIPGAPIIITFITFTDENGEILDAEIYQYNTVSEGIKNKYTNDDEIQMYGDKGILDPSNTSFFNVFINGVLQPKTNYFLKEGLLELKTTDIPQEGVPITVQFVTIKSKDNKFLKADVFQYNAYAQDKKVYTNNDEIISYGNNGIPDPTQTSYQSLYINGVIQPNVNYTVQPGVLTLKTEDIPLKDSPIILQSVCVYL